MEYKKKFDWKDFKKNNPFSVDEIRSLVIGAVPTDIKFVNHGVDGFTISLTFVNGINMCCEYNCDECLVGVTVDTKDYADKRIEELKKENERLKAELHISSFENDLNGVIAISNMTDKDKWMANLVLSACNLDISQEEKEKLRDGLRKTFKEGYDDA